MPAVAFRVDEPALFVDSVPRQGHEGGGQGLQLDPVQALAPLVQGNLPRGGPCQGGGEGGCHEMEGGGLLRRCWHLLWM